MAGKDKGKSKGGDAGKPIQKGKGKDNSKEDSGKAKGCQFVHVRHILCEKRSKIDEAIAKLNAGEKFDQVARDFSEDKARKGGDLGKIGRGATEEAFEKVVFEMPVSTVSSPDWREAKTSHGYHVIIVEKRE